MNLVVVVKAKALKTMKPVLWKRDLSVDTKMGVFEIIMPTVLYGLRHEHYMQDHERGQRCRKCRACEELLE